MPFNIIYFAKTENKNKENKCVCFVELKGSDVEKAVEQIRNTKKAFDKILQTSLPTQNGKKATPQVKWKAYIAYRSNTPSPFNTKTLEADLKKNGKFDDVLIDKAGKFSEFLRK
jgi:hypothetical protein